MKSWWSPPVSAEFLKEQDFMHRDNDGKRQPRRPRHESTPEERKEKMDRDFQRELEMRISYFIRSEEQSLDLEPMNSYRRRMVHTIAKKYSMTSESRGEDRDRFVCLMKSGETPAASEQSNVRLWDFGSQSFTVNPGENGLHLALKIDGSVEIWDEREKGQIIADRVVNANEIRIRQGKILVPGDAGY